MTTFTHTPTGRSNTGFVRDDARTWTHWNHPDWMGSICQISGTGKYRFNQYGTDGFAYWQYRFKTKDEAITFLCMQSNPVNQVFAGHPQYEVRDYYLESV